MITLDRQELSRAHPRTHYFGVRRRALTARTDTSCIRILHTNTTHMIIIKRVWIKRREGREQIRALFSGKIKHNGMIAYAEVEGREDLVMVRGHVGSQKFFLPEHFGKVREVEARMRRRNRESLRERIEDDIRFSPLLHRGIPGQSNRLPVRVLSDSADVPSPVPEGERVFATPSNITPEDDRSTVCFGKILVGAFSPG